MEILVEVVHQEQITAAEAAVVLVAEVIMVQMVLEDLEDKILGMMEQVIIMLLEAAVVLGTVLLVQEVQAAEVQAHDIILTEVPHQVLDVVAEVLAVKTKQVVQVVRELLL